jgi:hypothetical protein
MEILEPIKITLTGDNTQNPELMDINSIIIPPEVKQCITKKDNPYSSKKTK